MAARPDAVGTDVVSVWVCEVPLDTRDPTYADNGVRLPLTPDGVVDLVGGRLANYFTTISHGSYTVELVAGGTISMGAQETSADCVTDALEEAIAGGPARADVVLAVATAEHTAEADGGWGTPGAAARCAARCTLADSRRAAYVGGADFHPDWGAAVPLDLLEHELGHTLGLPHSGPAGESDTSALDLMSDSAAPRRTDPSRRDGPDIIGVDRLALGWIPPEDVVVVTGAQDLVLAPSTSASGRRLAVVALDAHRMLTIEHLTPTGYHSHLPGAGVAVHLVDDSADLDGSGIGRRQVTAHPAPSIDLVSPGEQLEWMGWEVTVTAADLVSAQLAIERTDG